MQHHHRDKDNEAAGESMGFSADVDDRQWTKQSTNTLERKASQADSYKACLSAGCGSVCLSVCQVIKSLVQYAEETAGQNQ